ncbi:uncharacterized protein BX664DRAFT_62126 [Halteromyces radiatus]|uniref:uncharacterized protein n=1 Tax=Halteromyces radiatus TaxID=101107 RepID=UPI0022209252|nr:uncharacterized protein BX664DRAFT_62126 [Halteromyces radiatus]KAI8096596.1 hypothetical protein BX664DRAFT_62126 [Halteromyces radiatus]
MSSDVHGRKREKTSADIIKAKREKDASKIVQYNDTVKECNDRVQAGLFDRETLNLTTQILQTNPDYYTIWNIRRQVLLKGILLPLTTEPTEATKVSTISSSDVEANQKVYLQELDLFMQLIRINPKSYWMWNHRRWCLETMPQPSWKGELKLVDKMLTMDGRNFHGWNYRQYVVSQLRKLASSKEEDYRIVEQEYEFTTQKIHQSFSNYSAWHQRSKLLPEIVAKMTMEERNQVARNELEMVNDAIFTEPDDQSAWLYYWWLIGKAPSPVAVIGAFRMQDSNSVMIGFNDAVGFSSSFPKVMTINGTSLEGSWYAVDTTTGTSTSTNVALRLGSDKGSAWLFIPDKQYQQQKDEPITIEIDSNTVHPISNAMTVESDTIWSKEIKVLTSCVTEKISQTMEKVRPPKLIHLYKDSITEDSNAWYSLDPITILKDQIAMVRELRDIEPDSKWTLHTLVHFLQQLKLRLIHHHQQQQQQVDKDELLALDNESIDILEKLIKLDTYRKERYIEAKNRILSTRQLDTLCNKNDRALLLYLLQLDEN